MNQKKRLLLILCKNIDQTQTIKRRDYSIISMPWSQKLPQMICKQKFKFAKNKKSMQRYIKQN